MTSWFNISGTLFAFRLLRDPTLCLPHHTVSTFAHLPVPLSPALASSNVGDEKRAGPDIRAVVLDKDNCFATPHSNEIYPAYKDKFRELRNAYPGSRLLIVSNTAGTAGDAGGMQARLLEQNTEVTVLRHSTKKPGCHGDIMEYFYSNKDSGVTSPSQVAIVGDRLLTDIMMANIMGSYGVWIRDGVAESGRHPNLMSRAERRFADFLSRRGYVPPDPQSMFE